MAMVCGICADGLCENHEEDCVTDGTIIEAIGGKCNCPNLEESDEAESGTGPE